jgi:hypothetical protein
MTLPLEYHIPVKRSVQRSIPALVGMLLCPLIFASSSAAQRAPTHLSTSPAPRFNSPARSFAFGRAAYLSRFHRPYPYTSLPFPFFSDSVNPDDIYSTGYPVASQPPMILLQAARAMARSADDLGRPDYDPKAPRAQPLVIELQNGRYVRVTSTAAGRDPITLDMAPNNDVASDNVHAGASKSAPAIAAASPPHDLPPALLIFRDGHSEEVRDYTIADGVLYARGDYYTDGYWNKKIELSTLNVAQTLEANMTRSVKFILPTSPNEVVTRP